MGECLFELEQVLRSKKLTSQEANVLMACKANAIRDFCVGSGVSGGVVWLATRRLTRLVRVNLTAGIAAVSGIYRFGQALDSCITHILSQEGSRMQQDLANIMLRKYRDDQPMMQRISKHFYPEIVFDDSSVDQSKLRWRYRNFFGDGVPQSEQTQDNNLYNEQIHEKLEPEPEPNSNSKTLNVSKIADTTSDPFNHVFGFSPGIEETSRLTPSSTLPGRHSRSHKRSRRRQRMHKREASLNSQHASADDSFMPI